MLEFYTLSWAAHIFLVFILGICVLAQTLALVLNFFRHRLATTRALGTFFEIAILLQILVFSFLYGQVLNSYQAGLLAPTGYTNARILTFIVILAFAVAIAALTKNLLHLSVLPAALVSLPVVENAIGSTYPLVFSGALIFFLVRSIRLSKSSIAAIKTNISALSVMQAIDTLHTGVLVSENNGHTLLANYQMQNLMITLTGTVYRNALQFYDALLADQYISRYEKAELEGQTIYLLDDGSAWMFTKTNISLRMKNYIHISAADVTQLWTLTAKLQVHGQELRHKSEELKQTIANLHVLSKEREIENAKMRAHDILGQRLTVLLRIIQNDSNLDYDLLTSLSKGLLAELKAEQKEIGAYDELESMQEVFAAIGVEIKFEGELPPNTQQASLFVDVIRESSTNAVRHGFATHINIKVEFVDHEYKLTINNNGHTTPTPITPGSGIRVMRRKVAAQGGNFAIKHYPLFTSSVVLPGGEPR